MSIGYCNQNTATLFSVWEIDRTTGVPLDSNPAYPRHLYIVVAASRTIKKENIVTCVPISTSQLNAFSVPILKANNPFLQHNSHVWCDHIVSFREAKLVSLKGYVDFEQEQTNIKDQIGNYLDVGV